MRDSMQSTRSVAAHAAGLLDLQLRFHGPPGGRAAGPLATSMSLGPVVPPAKLTDIHDAIKLLRLGQTTGCAPCTRSMHTQHAYAACAQSTLLAPLPRAR
jgi:hypothetical protein